MKIIDTHAHLDQIKDLDQALDNAREAGVVGIVLISMDFESSKRCLEIKKRVTDPKIYLGMGMHPSEANLDDLEDCVKLIYDNVESLHAIGEIGLDFWYKDVRKSDEKKEIQVKVFRRFLEVARDVNLPAVIHSRGAEQECLDIVLELGITQAEFHWYSGSVPILEKIIEHGYYVSTSPSVVHSAPTKEVMAAAPVERILLETDSPVYFKNRKTGEGFEAEPKDVIRTLKGVCQLKGLDPDQAHHLFNKNAKDFFHMDDMDCG